ncbi:MAG: type IX secretion system sortase PorU [Chitinophagales bacterium]|nr:type IX secretion system sortase PorU [Chitinophagales bacterium]
MLCIKQSFFLFAVLLASIHAYAQTQHIQIDWSKTNVLFNSEGKTISVPTFKNAIHLPTQKFIPTYLIRLPIPGETILSATITNEQYRTVDAFTENKDSLPTDIVVSTNVSTIKKKNFATVSILPIRLKNDIVEQLVSFDITIQSSSAASHRGGRSYASSSALATGTWRKVAVTSDGIYKLDYDFIKNTLKLDVSGDFSKIAVFGNGGGMVPEKNNESRFDDIQENAILRVDNNSNNILDAGDYILFYGQGADKWLFDATTKTFSHQKNLYADKNFYFVTTTQGTGKAIGTVPSASSNNQTASTFDDYQFHEIEEYNLLSSGRTWLGDKMSSFKTDISFSFDFPNIVTSSPVKYTSDVAANSPYSSTITLTGNGQVIASQNISGIPEYTYKPVFEENVKKGSFFAASNQISFNYNFNNPDPNSTSNGYINYLEVVAKRLLTLTGNAMPFRNADVTGMGNTTQFTLNNANSNTTIWDVTDPTNAISIATQLNGSTLTFNYETNTLKEFVAVNYGASFSAPEYSGEVVNQNLHGLSQKDLLIVTSSDLLAAAQQLGDFHNTRDNMRVAVVTTEQIYNEFGSGKQDISAIRDFVKMFYDRAGGDSTQLPKYLTLFGDGSFDPKDRISDNNNKVPTYQSYNSNYPLSSYTSDDFFGCLDPTEGGDMNSRQGGDIAIGRLPVSTLAEAEGVVSKIKKYKSAPSLGEWRNIITTIGDEIGHGGTIFQQQADKLGEYIRINNPNYNVEKIILDAYQVLSTPGGDRYPDVNAAILNRINNGTLAISYTGHGGIANLSNARIFNLNDIQLLKNEYRLPLFITATCEFSKFDDPEKKSAGEFLMTNNMGGGIGLITTVRPVFSDANDALQDALFNKLFEQFRGEKPTMGDLMTNTKNYIMNATDIENTRKFVFLGDAALTLNYPEYNVVTTEINNTPIGLSTDTFKALKQVTIKGEVQDWNGNRLNSFNGTCNPLVYDKLSSFKSLGNIPGYPIQSFNAYKNILFKGACSVNNGAFEYSFIVPSDINYQIGDGRISYYADNGDQIDAHGYNNAIKIGGAEDSFNIDTNGPQVKLYMDSITFEFGGLTDENPKMFGILEAKGGINTTGNGLGHDITAILDGDAKNPIVLNEFYQSDLDNFRKGKVEYPFAKLSEGKHSLKLKAWDIYNNSGEAYTEFVVSNSAKLALTHVWNYPNPVVDKTCFSFEHNCADEQFTVDIKIYSVAGVMVKRIDQTLDADGFRVDCIEWDGLDNGGASIGKGVYIYKLTLVDSKGNAVQKTERLVVLK